MLASLLRMELLAGSRRGRLDLSRRILAGWLIAQFLVLYVYYRQALALGDRPHMALTSEFVNSYLALYIAQHFLLLLLATPVFVAGAITDEKARGTLQELLTTHATSTQIVLGKLLGRLAQVAYLALTGAPLVCLVGAYGALEGTGLIALAAISFFILFALGAFSILVSVWCTKTRDAVVIVYAIGAVAFVALQQLHLYVARYITPRLRANAVLSDIDAGIAKANELASHLNPLHVLESVWVGHDVDLLWQRLQVAGLAWGVPGLLCLSVAVWRLRPAYVRQIERAGWTTTRWRPAHGPIDDAHPIAWKEREVEGLAPLASLRRTPRWLVMAFVTALTWLVARGDVKTMVATGVAGTIVASLLVGIRSSAAICGEHERQTWDLLRLTALEPKEIFREKYRGVLGATHPYWLAHAVPLMLLAIVAGMPTAVAVFFVLTASLAAVSFMCAVGLSCSFAFESSWRSLLATLAWGYGGGVVLLAAPLLFAGCLTWVTAFPAALAFNLLFQTESGEYFVWWFYAILFFGAAAWLLWKIAGAIMASTELWDVCGPVGGRPRKRGKRRRIPE